jgi:two-component system response regulator LytT
MTINCMILDDDPILISYLKEYILQIPLLNLLATQQSPIEALALLETLDIQLIFMDIGMPELNGIDMARLLHANKGDAAPRIVFITGFDRFAVESYQVNALDYLVKPVTFEGLLAAAHKARRYFESLSHHPVSSGPYGLNDFILLKVEHDIVRVYLKDILYIESFKDYVRIYTAIDGKVIKALTTLKSIGEKLPPNSFMRVHRSFIVSLDKIETIHHHTIHINKAMIPVTEQYRGEFKDFIAQWL